MAVCDPVIKAECSIYYLSQLNHVGPTKFEKTFSIYSPSHSKNMLALVKIVILLVVVLKSKTWVLINPNYMHTKVIWLKITAITIIQFSPVQVYFCCGWVKSPLWWYFLRTTLFAAAWQIWDLRSSKDGLRQTLFKHVLSFFQKKRIWSFQFTT